MSTNRKHYQVYPTQNQPHSRLTDDRGIRLREHFAGLALQGEIIRGVYTDHQTIAERAVKLADALCEELAK